MWKLLCIFIISFCYHIFLNCHLRCLCTTVYVRVCLCHCMKLSPFCLCQNVCVCVRAYAYVPAFVIHTAKIFLGPVSWRLTTVKWRQSNCHSTFGTPQTKYHKALPSSANVQSHLTSSLADDGNLYDTRFVECWWWDDSWTVVTWGRRPPWYRPLIAKAMITFWVLKISSFDGTTI